MKFCVVYQVGDEFIVPQKNTDILGVSPVAIWFFGTAKSSGERGIEAAARAAAAANQIAIIRYREDFANKPGDYPLYEILDPRL
jgi:hypothetical protein